MEWMSDGWVMGDLSQPYLKKKIPFELFLQSDLPHVAFWAPPVVLQDPSIALKMAPVALQRGGKISYYCWLDCGER